MTNLTQHRVALLTASIASGLSLVFLLAFYYLVTAFHKFIFTSVWVVFAGTYFVNRYIVEIFIYKKIKILYKTINILKKTGDKTDIQKPDLLEKVQKDVEEYADKQALEIKRLQETEKYRREFLGNVSHELKTPIFNIQGYLETLLEGGINDKNICLDYLQKAANNTERLGKIVEDLVFISLSESGAMKIMPEKFKIREQIIKVFEDLTRIAQSKKISLELNHDISTPFSVYADKEKIYQVLYNIVHNALKYSKKQSKIVVSCFDLEETILIEITDNGTGIAEEHLPRLFERFYRIDSARSRQEGGTGLGLSIVKHIIEAHEQTISVRSKIGVGTTFGFTLPKRKIHL